MGGEGSVAGTGTGTTTLVGTAFGAPGDGTGITTCGGTGVTFVPTAGGTAFVIIASGSMVGVMAMIGAMALVNCGCFFNSASLRSPARAPMLLVAASERP